MNPILPIEDEERIAELIKKIWRNKLIRLQLLWMALPVKNWLSPMTLILSLQAKVRGLGKSRGIPF